MGWSNKMRLGKIIKISWNGGIFRSFSYINSMNFRFFSQNLQFHPKLGTRKYSDTDILKKYDKIPVKLLGDNNSQLIFICTKSATETLEKVWNMYKVNNKETRTTSRDSTMNVTLRILGNFSELSLFKIPPHGCYHCSNLWFYFKFLA